MPAEKLWNEYRSTHSDDLKHKLIIRYLPLVKYLAGRLAVRFSSFISQEDLEGYGVFGLIEAVEKFNPDHGASFEGYAARRIQGSMIDELRKHNWVPRSLYQKLRKLTIVREELEKKNEGVVTHEELANELGITVDELFVLSNHLARANLLSLEREISPNEGEGVFLGRLLEDKSSPDPLEELIDKEDRKLLAKKIGELGERDRLILALYYKEKLTLKEIGQVLDVSESRVCQLHARALKRLREKMRAV